MSDYSPRACIPTGPILERIDQWAERHKRTATGAKKEGELTGGYDVVEELCCINVSHVRAQKMMTFDRADRILCKLGYFTDWYHHPVLSPIYKSLRLRPNEQDLRVSGDEEGLKRLLQGRVYDKTANDKRAQVRASRKQHVRALDKQRSERYDILEAEQAAA